MSGIVWKINRLRLMGAPEIIWRVGQTLKAKLEARGIGRAAVSVDRGGSGAPWLAVLPSGFQVDEYSAAANRVLDGRWDVFSLSDVALGFPPRWNRDPKSGREAPLVFGKTLDYRDESITGDIKYLWEPNRHLELVTLAQAYYLTRDLRYLDGCRQLLASWFEQCPYPLGPNWTSSLEHALRLTNWAVTWHLLGGERNPLFEGEVGADFKRLWLDSIYLHCHFIAGHFSRHSSANNHLFGEYMGLFLGTLTWPRWDESATWCARAQEGLEKEALLQNGSDGVNREQAIWYQHEVADMMLLCGLFGRANNREFSVDFWQRLEAMLEFIAALMNVSGHMPMIGDADDAVMVRFSHAPNFNVYRSLLATGAVLFARADFARKADRFDEKTCWLLGDAARSIFDQLRSQSALRDAPGVRRDFAEGGYYILGDRVDTSQEIRLIADAGPLGYLSIAAHGHADALSFTLSAAGREILIDPGTYAYHTQKQWRDYFRSTAAHNTLRVDGQDQSEIGGNFMWMRKARAHCIEISRRGERERFVGEHDGYARLDDPVIHRREIELNKAARCIEIVDVLECTGDHRVELFWHFAEACAVRVEHSGVYVKNGPIGAMLQMSTSDFSLSLLRGTETPIAGWISRHFDDKQPITTAVWTGSISGRTVLRTTLTIELSGVL